MVNIHYIVMDLEWNQNPFGKEKEDSRLPFEIVEIGAHKLNDKYEVIDSFQCLISPHIYTELNPYIKKIVPVTSDELEKGIDFCVAIKAFFKWCGKDVVFCTWGSMDLTELQRNIVYYNLDNPFLKPLIFYDIQKLFSIKFSNGKTRISLENAVDYLGIDKDIPFHRAKADTYYTVKVMQHMDMDVLKKNYSIDLYNNPKSRDEEIYATFETYSKFVSKEFDSKEEAMSDSVVTATSCFKCNKTLRKKVRWFSINGKIYYSLVYCEKHGWLKGKIRMKKTDEGKFFVIRTIKEADEASAAEVRIRKEEVQRKRRIRRHKGKE